MPRTRLPAVRTRRGASAVAVVTLGALTAVAPGGPAAAAAKPAPGRKPATLAAAQKLTPTARTITLITGDRLVVRTKKGKDAPSIDVIPGAGRRGVPMLRSSENGHTYVLPADAAALVGSGALDRELFDVTELLANGYDDASTKELPLLVRYGAGSPATAARKSLSAAGSKQKRVLRSVDATAVAQPKNATRTLWRTLTGPSAAGKRAFAPAVKKIWLDRKLKVTLDQSVPQIGAPAAWTAGYTGRGVKVAVLDTGYDATHPDLRDVVTASANFTSAPDVVDHVGHGTHVASTIAGSGAASGGKYKGVAPGAEVIVGKVCPDKTCPVSAVLAGMEWAADQGAKVVNLSLGQLDLPGDLEVAAVERLTRDKGVLFVAAAGNDYGLDGSVDAPGSAPSAISVGAVNRADKVANFSSRGPSGDALVKPDITAPGDEIVAARAADTGWGDDPNYTSMSGTSMATPHVVGAAAILLSQHPQWTPAEVKAALLASAHPAATGDAYSQGAGRVDVAKAITQRVFASPSTVDFGREYSGDLQRTLTYRNTGSEPVTLHLSASLTGPGGRQVPAAVTVEPAELTVPADGTADATVTLDLTRLSATAVAGWIVASADGNTVVRTSLGATHDARTRTVNVKALDRTGATNDKAVVQFVNTENGRAQTALVQGEGYQAYLSDGPYTMLAAIFTPANGGTPASWTVHTRHGIRVTADTTITLDARDATALTFDTGDPAVTPYATSLTMAEQSPRDPASVSVSVGGTPNDTARDLYVLGSDQGDDLAVTTQTTLVKLVDGSPAKSPVVYNLLYPREHRLPGPTVTVDAASLSAVPTEYAVQRPGDTDTVTTSAELDAPWAQMSSPTLPVAAPQSRTEYFSVGEVAWAQTVCQAAAAEQAGLCVGDALFTRREAGVGPAVRWHRAVFGPALEQFEPPLRYGIDFNLRMGLLSDATPGHASGEDGMGTGSSRLLENGEQVWSNDQPWLEFLADPASGTYRAEVELNRPPAAGRLSTKVTGAWTFHFDWSDETGVQVLPVMAVRFAPDLDMENRAPAGPFTLPVSVQRSSATPAVASVTVDVSYDDGATWQPAAVTGAGDAWSASLTHPDADGTERYVSLRTKATDVDGGTAEETIVRAYRLG